MKCEGDQSIIEMLQKQMIDWYFRNGRFARFDARKSFNHLSIHF